MNNALAPRCNQAQTWPDAPMWPDAPSSALPPPWPAAQTWPAAPSSALHPPAMWPDAPSSALLPPWHNHHMRKSWRLPLRLILPALFLLSSGCEPVPVPSKVDNDRSNQHDQQVLSNWDEQFASVLAGESDTLVVETEPITAPQLSQLSQLDGKLTQLLIEAGGVDDTAIAAIAQVRSLVHLRMRECPIGNQGLARLVKANMPELQILNIPQSQCTAEGIAQLALLPSLVQLRLGGKQIDDAAVTEIAKLPKLRSLHLIGPKLTDAALEKLAGSELLSTFYLDDCPLSDAAWQQLFSSKPKLHVHVDQAHHDRDPNQHDN